MNHILVIEDDEQTRENLQLILEMEGFAVRSAGDGRAGLAAVRAQCPDLIVCDVGMPHLDGHGLLRELRADATTANVPFIFLTARGERDDQRLGMNMGADDYLCKPLDAEDFVAAVRARLQRQRQNQEAVLRETELVPDFSSARPIEQLGLTGREAEVLLWVAQGKANGDVATILGMSEKTVKTHLGHIFEKLNVETRTAAAVLAIEALPRRRPSGSADTPPTA